jgi:quinol monooxygenase YgiN
VALNREWILSFIGRLIKNKSNMTVISKENKFLTLINVFTVDTAHQQRLIDLLRLATESSIKNITGFISASLHRGIDGRKVTMYAQWKSIEDYQNMLNNFIASPYLTQALEFAEFDMGMYEVVETFLPDDSFTR